MTDVKRCQKWYDDRIYDPDAYVTATWNITLRAILADFYLQIHLRRKITTSIIWPRMPWFFASPSLQQEGCGIHSWTFSSPKKDFNPRPISVLRNDIKYVLVCYFMIPKIMIQHTCIDSGTKYHEIPTLPNQQNAILQRIEFQSSNHYLCLSKTLRYVTITTPQSPSLPQTYMWMLKLLLFEKVGSQSETKFHL